MDNQGEVPPKTSFLGRLLGKGTNNQPRTLSSMLASMDTEQAKRVALARWEGMSHPDPAKRNAWAAEYTRLTGHPLPEVPGFSNASEHVTLATSEPQVLAATKAEEPPLRMRTRPPERVIPRTSSNSVVASPPAKA